VDRSASKGEPRGDLHIELETWEEEAIAVDGRHEAQAEEKRQMTQQSELLSQSEATAH
jgi:hypothetical protein